MIKTTKRIVACMLFSCLVNMANAQDQTTTTTDQPVFESDTAIATRQALLFADSLVKADHYAEWKTYLELSCPSAIKYYGGKEGFQENAVVFHYRNEPKTEEKLPKLKVTQVLLTDVDTWQVVIEKVRNYWEESRGKVDAYTYLVGNSTDNGLSWKFVDVSHNSLQNLVYILPTVSGKIEIPESKTIYVDEVAAQEAAKAAQPAVKKKPVVKKVAK